MRFWPEGARRGPRCVGVEGPVNERRPPCSVVYIACTLFCVQLIYYNALALPCVRGPGVCSALNPAVRL